MATLILLRHGKSDWHGDAPDRQRPLSPRGRRASRAMGQFLSRVGEMPDLAITSPATRARETLSLAVVSGGWTCAIEEREGLYGGGVEQLVRELRAPTIGAERVLVVGHEPTWSSAVAVLTGGSEVRMPTAAAACIEFGDQPWTDVQPGTGVLCWLVTPRLIALG